jgi:hypothetical protein
MIFLGTGNRGDVIKKKLGLQNFKNVYYFYLIGINPKIYFIIFDSWTPNRVWNTKRIRSQLMLKIKRGKLIGGMTNAKMTPLWRMETFNDNPNKGLYVAIDLCGSRFVDKEMYTKIKESVEEELKVYPVQGRLSEFIKIANLQEPSAMSPFTMGFRKERTKLMGTENLHAKLIDVILEKGNDSITFQFLTSSTPKYGKDYQYKSTDPQTKDLKPNPSKTYEIDIQLLQFFSWLKTYPDKTKITAKDIRDIFDVCYCKVWSDSPDFHWQGKNWALTQLDGSIYGTDIAPTVWKKRLGGEYMLSKQMYGLFKNIKFFYTNMSKMLNRKLKERGYL